MRASTYPLLEASEALRTVLEATPVGGVERVAVGALRGRVLGRDVIASHQLPSFPASAVDGYAHHSSDHPQRLSVVGESAAGRPWDRSLGVGEAIRILTGAVVPEGADAVTMLEDAEELEGWVRLPLARSGQNLHAPGADVEVGQVVLGQGSIVGPAELGLLGALGLASADVHRRPRVALMSTGDELVEVGTEPGPGQIVDSNRWALNAALEEAGAVVTMLGIAPDEPGPLRRLVQEALLEHDVLVTSGGVSVGTHDLVKPLLAEIGQVLVGRVKVRPGKPFTFATLPGGKIAFGLPGFPVSSLVTLEVFVRPALRRMQGMARLERPLLTVKMGFDARSPGDRTDYHRVRLEAEGDHLVAHSTGRQSSSRLLSMAGAQALVRVPPGETGLAAGSLVPAMILDLN